MKKTSVENIVASVPQALKIASSYVKDSFDKNGQDALGNMTGAMSILIKLFAKDKIDNYFEKITEDKLKDFGVNIYLKASFIQLNKSLEFIKVDDLIENGDMVYDLLENIFTGEKSFNKEDLLTIFTPIYHPIVVNIKKKLKLTLNSLSFSETMINKFIRNFNENIENTLIECFGESDYKKHLDSIKSFSLEENEAKLLWDTYQLHKIGFKEEECLEYEETYAEWKPVSSLFKSYKSNEDIQKNRKLKFSIKTITEEEKKLSLAEDLVNEYFNSIKNSNFLKNILFIVADFGKGKSVFMKQYASKLAKSYIETKEGYFPIYFNLRDFSKYSSDATLGVLGDYLITDYQIKIENEYFKKKKYIFLVDSLDESGDLTTNAINKVIESIKSIQNIDKEISINNKIIITSRPFSDGLENKLKSYEPFELEDNNKNKIPQFISVYGFKAKQFNHWLYSSLKSHKGIARVNATGFAKEVVDSILNNDNEVDIYNKLLNENTLTETELRRPIFAYMIFQLIINNVDFLKIGKIGVYLSFINLLTKEAKHIDDKNYKVNLKDEIRYRNILHSISALWMRERLKGEQGILKKADICRVLEAKNTSESDKEILERFSREGVNEIQFLSHSYFGENNNILHFQHQSFAEILLAEYYLKVFIRFALDNKLDVLEARSKLVLGEPTEQTILFFVELIKLLKETVSSSDNIDESLIEKRKLLFPLLASLALEEHNPIYSNDLYYDWFKRGKFDSDLPEYPKELLEKWAITDEKLEKIINLASKIIDCKNTLLMTKTSSKNSLFDSEVTVFENKFVSDKSTDIDKWLALTIGNVLETNINDKKFFNAKLSKPENLFEMIRNWNYSNNNSAPEWGKDYFMGIDMKNSNHIINMNSLDLSKLIFSYSTLKNINLNFTKCTNTIFSNCIFERVEMRSSIICESSFDNIEIRGGSFIIGYSILSNNVFIPMSLANFLLTWRNVIGYANDSNSITFLSSKYFNFYGKLIFNTLKGLLNLGLKERLFDIKEIKTWFAYENDKVREKFEKLIDTLDSKEK